MRFLVAAAAALLAAAPATAQVLDRLAAEEPLRIAVRDDARPLSWTEGQAPKGYSVSLCLEVARRVALAAGLEGVNYRYVPVSAETRFDAIEGGEADLLCGAATVTLSRRDRVEFSIPTFVDGASVMVRADADISGLGDFAGRRIGVRGATTTETALRNTLERMEMQAEVVAVESHEAGLAALLAGEIDAYFADRSILLGLATGAAGDVAVSSELLTVERHALALPRGDHAWRQAVDGALSRMYADGAMRRIFAESFPGARPGLGLEALWLLGGLPE
ncbi:MAG TPA: amino acid ABC transporter substrate-binding protein [Paracoccaceae bacterium]|nr:amino acid ABC transporter substrate-binding protein [Paracoccaceae bacterium]